MQGPAGETVDGDQFQNYGFGSLPLPGAEYIVIPVGGNSKHAVIVASEGGRYRLLLQDGEASLYTAKGDYLHMKRGCMIEIVTDDLVLKVKNKVRFETPLVESAGDGYVEGNVKGEGEIADHIRTMQADRDIYNQHKHGSSPTPSLQQ